MTLVNYAYHTNVTDSKDWLSKLRTFAIAQGWDGTDYQTSVQWDSPTGWIAGSGDFLQLTSTCYGSCDKAVYRFYAKNITDDEDLLHHCAHTTDVYDPAGISPVSAWNGGQNYWAAVANYWGTSMPSSAHGIDKMWLFGNQYYIYVVCQFDEYLMPTWHFGSIDLYPEYESRTDCAFFGSSNYQYSISSYVQTGSWSWTLRARNRWGPGVLFSYPWNLSLDDYRVCNSVYFSGRGQNWYDEGASYSYWPQFTGSSFTTRKENGVYNFCKNVLETTGYSAKRLGFKVDFFAQDTAVGNIVPLGKTPFYVIPFNGMAPGESLTVSGQTYLCFPFIFTYWNRGYAFRIA